MREPADLPTPRQAEYAERKRQIAFTRAAIVDSLLDARAAEERGEVDVAMQAAVIAHMLCDDLQALLEEWYWEWGFPAQLFLLGSVPT